MASAALAAPIRDPAGFIRDNTVLRPVPLVPELVLHVADEALALWERTEEELGAMGLPPPFWAFAWAGGQALARYLLDRPHLVAGKRVLDLGCGSGLTAIAAAKAGAAAVLAVDIDEFAIAAAQINGEANRVALTAETRDMLDETAGADVILVGDLFYEKPLAERALAFLRRARAAGSAALIGDPGRTYLPKSELHELAVYSVPVSRALEDYEIKRTAVWRLAEVG